MRNSLKPTVDASKRPQYNFLGVHITTKDGDRTRAPAGRAQGAETIVWSVDDQAWAVSEGFFVERALRGNQPILKSISEWRPRRDDHPDWHYIHENDGARSIETIERHVFWMTPGYERLLRFIEQQDKYAYSYAWVKTIERHTRELFWYKHWVAKKLDRRSPLDAIHREKIRNQSSSVEGTKRERIARRLAGHAQIGSKIAQRLADHAEKERLIDEARLLREQEFEARRNARPSRSGTQSNHHSTAKPTCKLRMTPDTKVVLVTKEELDELSRKLASERIAKRGW